jgi:hypothetical protein
MTTRSRSSGTRSIRRCYRRTGLVFASMVSSLALTWAAYGQEVILDRAVRAGELTLFPSVHNATEYYYVADRVELAQRDGRPEFSFLQYVDSGGTSADSESGGGGVVHALVKLSVDEDLVREAQRALTAIDGNGRIRGPVSFRSGKFALVSSFAETNGEFTDAIMGIGKAPLLEGERAAVSLRLTREGAEVLRRSLASPTPDLSFSFEMEIDGYRSPRVATLEANFDRIYSHNVFSAGIATPYLQADIEAAFDDLRRRGDIRLTEVGPDENMSQLIQTAYAKLIEIMFEAAPTTGTDALAQMRTASEGGGTILDRAANLLSAGRREARQENNELRQRNEQQAERNAQAAEVAKQSAELRVQHREATNRAENARSLERRAQARLDAELAAQQSLGNLTPAEQEALRTRIEAARRMLETHRAEAETAEQEAQSLAPQVDEASARAREAQTNVRELESPATLPSLAIVASYKMKRSRVSGSFTINLNKYTVATQTIRFNRNLGDLRRHLRDIVQVFDRGDTAFRRRDVGVIIDGENVTDFKDFVNTATVVLEKTHQDGSMTQRAISVNRVNFGQDSTKFKLSYNRLGDEAGADFLTYRYQVLWNFFGGIEMAETPRVYRGEDITISPPMTRRMIEIEADPTTVSREGIRIITLRIFYNPGDRERVIQLSLRPGRDGQEMSKKVYIVLPDDRADYAYEMRWVMQDGSSRSSARVTTNQPAILADVMPGR